MFSNKDYMIFRYNDKFCAFIVVSFVALSSYATVWNIEFLGIVKDSKNKCYALFKTSSLFGDYFCVKVKPR